MFCVNFTVPYYEKKSLYLKEQEMQRTSHMKWRGYSNIWSRNWGAQDQCEGTKQRKIHKTELQKTGHKRQELTAGSKRM